MKSKKNIRNILIFAILGIISLFFINVSLAVNTAKINVETANLRETADENSKILEQLPINQEVEIIEKEDDWYKVKVNGISGYLRKDLLDVKEEISDSNTTTNNEVNVETNNADTTVENNDQAEVENESNKKIVKEDTKLKIVPTINATDIVEIKKGEKVNVSETINGWAFVETTTTKGWIRAERLQQEETKQKETETSEDTEKQEEQTKQQIVTVTKYVNSTTVNLRKEANTDSEKIMSLALNTAVEVISEENGWSKVKVGEKEGYISSSLLSEKKQETSRGMETSRKTTDTSKNTTTENTQTTTSTTASGNGSSVVATAKQYIGSKYVYGGTTTSGFDCSGFTSYVYKQFGISLNRTAAGQYSNGTSISRENLQAGDLVMFGKSGINHVGIYIGGGQMVHAANPSRGVTTDTINSGYYNTNYVGARRIL